MLETSKEGGSEIERLQRFEGREEGPQLLHQGDHISRSTSTAQHCIRSYISRLLRVPEPEEVVESPFDALDATLLVLLGVLGGEGDLGNGRPVGAPIEVQQAQIA